MKKIIVQILLFVSLMGTAQERTIGLFLNTEDSYDGYTLFSNSRQTYLIDNCGIKVNEWTSEYAPGLGVYLMDNGHLLRTGRINGSFNGGGVGGVFEIFDWKGELLWNYMIADGLQHAHHDVAVLPNGNFLAIVWYKMNGAEAVVNGRVYDGDVWLEKIVEIQPTTFGQANIVWEWQLGDHLVQDMFPEKPNYGIISDHPGKLNFNELAGNAPNVQDWVHLNGIAYNPELDQIAISSRNFSEIYVIDHSTTTEEAKTSEGGQYGKGGDFLYRYGNPQIYDRGTAEDQVLFAQHNIEWIENVEEYDGYFSVFNNQWAEEQSAVHIWDPPFNGNEYILNGSSAYGPSAFQWTYSDPDFYSGRISGAQVLPNTNVLICEGESGHFFEVTQDGELVWDYLNPVNNINGPIAQGNINFFNATFRARRYSKDDPIFDNVVINPTTEIELDPLPNTCIIFDNPSNTEDLSIPEISFNTLIYESLHITSSSTNILWLSDLQGNRLIEKVVPIGHTILELSHIPAGVYFISWNNERSVETRKVIKM